MKHKTKETISGILVLIAISPILILLVGCGQIYKEKCVNKTISSVGGCGSRGYCGVMYDDFSFGVEYLPVPLKSVEVCK